MPQSATTTKPVVVDCPVPPSLNRLWRFGKRRVYRNAAYLEWQKEFWVAWLQIKPKGYQPIADKFDAEILICPKRKRDADNSAKSILDSAQAVGIFVNDSQARRVVQELVGKERAPLGCQLRIYPLGS